MKRVWAVMVSASVGLLGGCGLRDYEDRLDKTYVAMEHKRDLDLYLNPPVQGKFKEYSVYFRPPKPLNEVGPAWTLPQGAFDHAASFQGAPAPAAAKEGEPLPLPLPPLKVNVLIRSKPKAPKKGAAPQAQPNRGDFVADVRQVLSGYGPDAAEKALASVTKDKNSYKSLVFKDASTGNDVRAYFIESKDKALQVAIVYDIPAALRTLPIVAKGVEFSLESFAMGRPAALLFNGAEPGSKAAASQGSGF